MLQPPQSTAEKWLAAICVGSGTLLIGLTELVLTTPDFAAPARRIGILVPVPSQPIGYIGGFNLGLVLAIGIGAAVGTGIYRLLRRWVR